MHFIPLFSCFRCTKVLVHFINVLPHCPPHWMLICTLGHLICIRMICEFDIGHWAVNSVSCFASLNSTFFFGCGLRPSFSFFSHLLIAAFLSTMIWNRNFVTGKLLLQWKYDCIAETIGTHCTMHEENKQIRRTALNIRTDIYVCNRLLQRKGKIL